MPLLTSEDLGGAASVFRGRLGEALWQGLSRVFSIDRINELYDTCSCFSGSDFAGKVLADIAVNDANTFKALAETASKAIAK